MLKLDIPSTAPRRRNCGRSQNMLIGIFSLGLSRNPCLLITSSLLVSTSAAVIQHSIENSIATTIPKGGTYLSGITFLVTWTYSFLKRSPFLKCSFTRSQKNFNIGRGTFNFPTLRFISIACSKK
ncbi:hypothetical protein ACJW30_09G069800 [Castanea mollissima]